MLKEINGIHIVVKEGFKLNDNMKIVNAVTKRASMNNGECPCQNTGRNRKCPCSDYIENDNCHCSLYIKCDPCD